jgi:hypothetical protein
VSDAKVSDLLGVKPLGEAANKAVSSVLDGCAALLGRICLPAAEEFGLGLRDRVAGWRARNLAAAAAAAERKLGASGGLEGLKAHPRLVRGFIDEASWVDDPDLQEMWGGLLASSCTEDGLDDSNVLFQDLLSGMTGLQARVLRYACEHSQKFVVEATRFALADEYSVDSSVALSAFGVGDSDRLDRELDRLTASGLLSLGSGFPLASHGLVVVNLAPTTLGMHLYVRCQGSRESPVGYFKITEIRKGSAVYQLANGVVWRPLVPEGGAVGPIGS